MNSDTHLELAPILEITSVQGTLSPRELEVLEQLSRGHRQVEIGRLLDIAGDTVKTHLKRIFVKLGARNAPHAVAIGYSLGLLSPLKDAA